MDSIFRNARVRAVLAGGLLGALPFVFLTGREARQLREARTLAWMAEASSAGSSFVKRKEPEIPGPSAETLRILTECLPPEQPNGWIIWHEDDAEWNALLRLAEVEDGEIPAALDWLRRKMEAVETVPCYPVSSLASALIIRWAKLDPVAAVEWALRNPVSVKKQPRLLDQAAVTWASRDPRGMLDWWRKNRERLRISRSREGLDYHESPRERLQFELAGWLARSDALAAAECFVEEPELPQRENAPGRTQRLAFPAEAVKNPAEARAVAEILQKRRDDDDGNRRRALNDVLKMWAAMDDAGLETWLDTNSAVDEKTGTDGREILGMRRMRSAPADRRGEAADAWLQQARSLEERSKILTAVVKEWTALDLNAAGEWLNRQPRTPERAEATGRFAERVLAADPAAAFAWLETIPVEAERERRIAGAFARWSHADPDAARAFLETSGWSETRRRWIRERLAVLPP